MDQLEKQVNLAQKRLFLQFFAERIVWCLLASFLVAAVALIVPKVWFLQVDPQVWMWSWLGGAALVGVLSALTWSYFARKSALQAAIELDLRYGLRERVSSSLTLDSEEVNSEAGQALLNDAVRRVERIDVSEKFPVKTNWTSLLPVGAALLAFVLATVLPNAALEPNPNDANANTLEQDKKIIEKTTKDIKKQLEERRKKAEEKGLKEAGDLFKKLEESAEKINKKGEGDQKKTLVELNDLAKQLKERRQSLSNSEDFKKQLDAMKNISEGPAEKLAKAMKDGDIRKAMDELKNLQKQMANNKMNPQQQQKLAKQLAEMKQKNARHRGCS